MEIAYLIHRLYLSLSILATVHNMVCNIGLVSYNSVVRDYPLYDITFNFPLPCVSEKCMAQYIIDVLNGNTQQCYFFDNKVNKLMNVRRMMGQTGTAIIKLQIQTQMYFDHPSPV